MFEEHALVKLRRPSAGLEAGTVGVIVMVYPANPPAYEVEFLGPGVVTLALLTLQEDDLESVGLRSQVTVHDEPRLVCRLGLDK